MIPISAWIVPSIVSEQVLPAGNRQRDDACRWISQQKKEDLFAYSGIVLGSIESTFFNNGNNSK